MTNLAEIGIKEAKKQTRINLVAADSIPFEDSTYAKREKETQSKAHANAVIEGIKLFRSLGYKIYPHAVGVKGVYTLADFLAVQGGRIIFVECLTDNNLKPDTIKRKKQLQEHGELCFICMTGSKSSDSAERVALKESLGSEFDVILYSVHGYYGGTIVDYDVATVAWDTTKAEGIKVHYNVFEERHVINVRVKFKTRSLTNPFNTTISYCRPSHWSRCEDCFLSIFHSFINASGGRITNRSHKKDIWLRAMRRKAGLKASLGGSVVSLSVGSGLLGGELVSIGSEERYTYEERDDLVANYRLSNRNQVARLLGIVKCMGLTPVLEQ